MPHRSNFSAPARLGAAFALTGLALALSACGGGSDSASSTAYTLGGTVAALNVTGLILSNGSANTVSVARDATTFTFNDSQTGNYDVKVFSQPKGETCSVSNGSGSGGTNVSSVAVTCRPYAVFVANETDSSISQFSVGTDGTLSPASTPTIATPYRPTSMVISQDGTHAWVGYDNNRTITNLLVDSSGLLSIQSATPVAATNTYGLALSPDDSALYSADYGNLSVSQFSLSDSGIATAMHTPFVAAGRSPYAIATTPDGAHVYVANQNDDSISGYSTDTSGALTPLSTASVSTSSYGTTPQALAVDASGTYLYVTLASSAKIISYAINASTGALTYHASQSTGTTPNGIVINGIYAYVTNYGSNTISQYSLVNGAITKLSTQTVPTDTHPTLISFTPSGYLYAVNSGSNTISQYAIGSDGMLVPLSPATVATGSGPFGLAVR